MDDGGEDGGFAQLTVAARNEGVVTGLVGSRN
jgi:hypothetical protein